MQDSGFIEVDNVSLEYQWIAGKTNGPVLVLLHEGLGCLDMWKGFPELLAIKTGLSVFVYSRQGYGRSDPCVLPRPVSYMHDEAQLLNKLLSQIPGKSFIPVGHSDGASIASIYAGRYPGHDIQGMVLMAPHFYVEQISLQSIKKIKVLYETDDLSEHLEKYHPNQVDTAFRGWNDVWLSDAFLDWNICEYLLEINVPTLVIQGDRDEYGSEVQMHTAECLINAPVTTRLFKNCGHSAHSEFEHETVKEIARFLES